MGTLWQGAPNESVTQNALGVDALETTPEQVLGATAGQAFADSYTARTARALFTPVAVPEAQAYWQGYRDPASRDGAPYGTTRNNTPETDAIAAERGDGPAMLDPDEANRQ